MKQTSVILLALAALTQTVYGAPKLSLRSSTCGLKGFNGDSDGYYWSQTEGTVQACSAACKRQSGRCKALAVGNGECNLYDRPVAGNFEQDPNSPYVFYDVTCFGSPSSSSSSRNSKTTTTTTTTAKRTSISQTSRTVSSDKKPEITKSSISTTLTTIATTTTTTTSFFRTTTSTSKTTTTTTTTTSVKPTTQTTTAAQMTTRRKFGVATTPAQDSTPVSSGLSSTTTTNIQISTSTSSAASSNVVTTKPSSLYTSSAPTSSMAATTQISTTTSSTSTGNAPPCAYPTWTIKNFAFVNSTRNLDCSANGRDVNSSFCSTPLQSTQPSGYSPPDKIAFDIDNFGRNCFQTNPGNVQPQQQIGNGTVNCGGDDGTHAAFYATSEYAAYDATFKLQNNVSCGNGVYYMAYAEVKNSIECAHDEQWNASCVLGNPSGTISVVPTRFDNVVRSLNATLN